MNILGIK